MWEENLGTQAGAHLQCNRGCPYGVHLIEFSHCILLVHTKQSIVYLGYIGKRTLQQGMGRQRVSKSSMGLVKGQEKGFKDRRDESGSNNLLE